MRTIARLSAIALAIAASSAAHAVATYSFTYEGTQFSYPASCSQSSCDPGPTSPWSGTLTLTVTGGVNFTSQGEVAPYGDGTFGSTWDGYTGRDIDPNTEITISVDGHNPLNLNRNVSVTVFNNRVSIFGNTQQFYPGVGNTALYIFNGKSIDMGAVGPDRSETYAHGILTAVPEPESWALMLAGFGVIGALGQRRLARKGAR